MSCVGQVWEDTDEGELFLIVQLMNDYPGTCRWRMFSLTGSKVPGRDPFMWAADGWFGAAYTRRIA